MPPVSEHVELERPPKLGGGGPGKIPHRFGFGGGGDDGDPNRRERNEQHERRISYRILMVICIFMVAVLFIALAIAYLFRRSVEHYDQDLHSMTHVWRPLVLPYLQLWINTLVLLLSSGTLELARRQLHTQSEFATLGIVPPAGRKELPWLLTTLLLGLGFLAGQAVVWNILRLQGMYLVHNSNSAFFYAFTGLHAAHLLGGLTAMIWVLFRTWRPRRVDFREIALQATSWYWHFMGILWVAIFALLYFTRK
jgi:cytochrome c oxidase subunit III